MGSGEDQAPTIRVRPSAPGSQPAPGQPGGFAPAQPGFGAPPQYPPPAGSGAGPQFAPPATAYGGPPQQGYPPPATAYGGPPPQGFPSQPGFPPAQPGLSAPPPGFSGPPQPGYGGPPPQGFAPQPGFLPPGPRKKGKGGLIAIIAAVVVVVVIVGVVAAIALGGKKSPTTSNNPGSSTTTGNQSGNTPKATATSPSSSGNVPTGFTGYNGGLYTIAYPQDWTVEPSGQEEGTTSFTGQEAQILQVDVENAGDENTSQYLALYCQTLGDTDAVSPKPVTIGGQQWQKVVCNVDGQPAGEAAAVTYKGHIFTINTLSLAGTYATDVPQFFQPMEQSFAFTS